VIIVYSTPYTVNSSQTQGAGDEQLRLLRVKSGRMQQSANSSALGR
jgi:hypothetical protein